MRFAVLGVVAALAVAGLGAGTAEAAVTDATPTGFQVVQKLTVKASPENVWAVMVKPSLWWESSHTWFGDASRLTLDLRPDGCFCETGPNGAGAAHLKVILVEPNRTLRLWGALGPLSTFGMTGAWTMQLKPADGGTEITWTYTVGGYMPGGIDKLAAPVDGVMTAQLVRMGRVVETGKAE